MLPSGGLVHVAKSNVSPSVFHPNKLKVIAQSFKTFMVGMSYLHL